MARESGAPDHSCARIRISRCVLKRFSRLQWVRNGLTLTTAADYYDKVRSDRGHGAPRGGAGQRVGYTKQTCGSSHLNHPRITSNMLQIVHSTELLDLV